MYEWLKLGHIVGAIAWVGAGIMSSFLFVRAKKAPAEDKLALMKALLGTNALFVAASIFVLGFGIWMVIDSPTIGFGDTWIVVAYAGLVLSGALNGALFGPQAKKLQAELEQGDPGANARWGTLSRIAPIDSVILLVIVWAMVTKPGL
jgi:uncharacterized membrane protein